MKVSVQPTYQMSKLLGVTSFDVEDVGTVADVVAKAKAKVGPEFDKLTSVAAIAVNGELVNYKKGLETPLSDGDVVAFVKASSGG